MCPAPTGVHWPVCAHQSRQGWSAAASEPWAVSLAGLLSPSPVPEPRLAGCFGPSLLQGLGWLGNRGSQSPTEADLLLRAGAAPQGSGQRVPDGSCRSITHGPQPVLGRAAGGALPLPGGGASGEPPTAPRTARTGARACISHTSPAGASQPGRLSSGATAWSEGQRSTSAVWVAKAAGRAEPICAMPTGQRGWAQAVGQEPGS